MSKAKKKSNFHSQKILVTGGHLTPAQACIEELIAKNYKNIVYVGQKRTILFDKNLSAEYKVITSLNLKFISIIAGKYSRFLNFHALIWLFRIPIGFIHALLILLSERPKLVLSFGSHVALPIVFWARMLSIPVVTHEQTVTIGLSNKIIQFFADKVCYSWENNEYNVDNDKYILTGNPVRKAIRESYNSISSMTKNNDGNITILVTGGNQGAHVINQYICDNIHTLIKKYRIIHLTGSNTIFNDYSKAKQIENIINNKFDQPRYFVYDYVSVNDMINFYKKADILITRAGANTVAEIIILRKKALVIPIKTTSGNEQFLNAKLLEKLGLGHTINQDDLYRVNLDKLIVDLLKTSIEEKEIESISKLHLNAHKNIVKLVLDILEEKTL
ncbi:MAG: glycosyltransferase [Candidatus Dojkabacteria bacterium]|nr:glycosyltransferase [Candidatus Dojkabacteria bacterium]